MILQFIFRLIKLIYKLGIFINIMNSPLFDVVEMTPIQPIGKTILQAFTGSGLVASLVANHVIDCLGLIEKGYISSSLIPSVGIVRDGIIQRPIRIYESDKYILVLSEVAIIEENLVEFIDYLFDWYSKIDPSSLIIIGALPTGRPNDATDLRYNIVASDDVTREFLSEKGIWTLPQGAIYGSVALSLMESKRSGIACFSILSHCIATIPDYLAAKKVSELLNIVLDENMDLSKLNANALELKDHLINRSKQSKDDLEYDDYNQYDSYEYDESIDDDEDDDLSAFI